VYRVILVPLDGSSDAERALPFARVIASAAGARLLLLRVVDASAEADHVTASESVQPVAEAEGYLRRLATSPADVPAKWLVLRDEPAARIAEEARQRDVGLVVMSTRWRDGLASLTDHSIAADVLRHVATPLLVVPRHCAADWSRQPPARVVVAVDGSELANAALLPAADLARVFGAELRLIGVVVPSAYVPVEGYPNPIAGSTRGGEGSLAERYLYRLAADLPDDDLATGVEAAEGEDPASTIVEVAGGTPADAIALATHGRTGLARLLLGSTANRVVDRAAVPVLLVRPAALA
jgi:nucleotide-binding universal stress UspA family protein